MKKSKRDAKSPQLKSRRELPSWVWYALCFILPALTLTGAYAAEGFYPFGDKSILICDMAQEFVEYFCALKQGDVFFSWSKALGSSYIGVFASCTSPLSLLTLLVPNEAMPLGLMLLVILKVGLAGLSYSVFARHYFDRLDICTVLGAVAYSLCTYAMAYSMCVMWLDGMIWLPIIVLGLEWLLDGKRRWLFPLSLLACFSSTWYISYMIGGFCLLWFIARVVVKGLDGKSVLLRLRDFLLSALWALCMTAWLWLPILMSVISGTAPSTDYDGLFNFQLPELVPQLFFGQVQYVSTGALPYIFCGSITLFAALAYFFLQDIPPRQRVGAGVLVAVMVASMWLSPLDKVWHLFAFPNWFPYRYAFLFSFVLAFLAQHTFHRIKDAVSFSRPAALALAVLLCWEMGANARLVFQTMDNAEPYLPYSDYAADYATNADLVAQAKADAPTGEFYRMGATLDRSRNVNSPLSYGYNGITHYSSYYNAQVNSALRSLGLAQGWYWCAYYGSSHMTDALLDIRYVIDDREVPGYTALGQAGDLTLFENPNTVPLAFLAQGTADLVGDTAVQRQNQIFSALTGTEEPLYTPIAPQMDLQGGWTGLTFTGTGQPIYLDLTAGGVWDLQKDGRSLFRYDSNSGKVSCLHCLGAPAPGESLTVWVNHDGSWSGEGKSYALNADLLAQGVAELNNTEVTVSGSRVDVTVDAPGGAPLLTTIPAEDGWQAYVDGKAAALGSWMDDTFLALDLSQGSHSVTLRYTAPGLRPGLVLGVLALAGAGTQIYLKRKKKKENVA